MINIDKIRAAFPILSRKVNGQDLVYFDNGATTQKPQAVIDAESNYYANENANVQTLDEALSYKGKEGYIVAAERNAKPIEGFDYGNSPFHYINADVAGKTLVLTTTNGTKAIYNAKEHKVITASYINIEAVAKHLIEENNDVIILCSGWKGVFNLEDPIFAGSLAKLLLDAGTYESNCDSLFASLQLLKNSGDDLFNYLSDSSHRRRLKSLNMEDDTRFCLSPPVKSTIIPILKGDKLVIL